MRILFQGDSITDAGRDYNNNANLGRGYALMVSAELGFSFANEYEFINKGISGNRVVDVYARLKRDIINLKPDVMSILIGVNDVGHEYTDNPNGVEAERYFKVYDMLIEEIKKALPDIKIMILEPFVLEGYATAAHYDEFRREVELRAEKAKAIAEKYNLVFISLQEGFDKLCKSATASYWISDGIHPTPAGHNFIKNEWIKSFELLK